MSFSLQQWRNCQTCLMCCIFVIVEDDHIVNNVVEIVHACESFIHIMVIMFAYAILGTRILEQPKGIMKVVRFWLTSSSGQWWYPFSASNTMALAWVISTTVSAGVVEGCSSRQTSFSLEKTTHMRILSEFFCVTTIGAHHSVNVVTGAMMLWLVSGSIYQTSTWGWCEV